MSGSDASRSQKGLHLISSAGGERPDGRTAPPLYRRCSRAPTPRSVLADRPAQLGGQLPSDGVALATRHLRPGDTITPANLTMVCASLMASTARTVLFMLVASACSMPVHLRTSHYVPGVEADHRTRRS